MLEMAGLDASFPKAPENPENAISTDHIDRLLVHYPTRSDPRAPSRIPPRQRSLGLFWDGFGNGWWYCLGRLSLSSRQSITEPVICGESLQVGGFPHRADVLFAVVVWPVLLSRDRGKKKPIRRARPCPMLNAPFCSVMSVKMIWGAVFEVSSIAPMKVFQGGERDPWQ